MANSKEEIVEIIKTPFFYSISLTYNAFGILSVSFIDKSVNRLLKHKYSYLTEQFLRYFDGEKIVFSDILYLPSLSPFTKKVLHQCKKIPYGTTITYKELSIRCGANNSFRAVGGALKRNPLPIIIPCHRVIGSDGSLTGYMGTKGLEIKRSLLKLEGII